jgi:hypothetical protein
MSISAISNHLNELFTLADETNKKKISDFAVKFHESMLSQMKYIPQDNEPLSNTIIRSTLLLNASKLGSAKATEFALNSYQDLKNGKEISPEIIEPILAIAAKHLNEFDWFLNKFESAKNEVEVIRYGNAMAEFRQDSLIKKVLEEIVFQKIPMRNRSTIIDGLCQNPHAVDKMWKFYTANLDNFEKMHEHMQMRSINSIVTYAGLNPTIKKDMEKFFESYENPIAKVTIEKSFETLAIKLQVQKTLTT